MTASAPLPQGVDGVAGVSALVARAEAAVGEGPQLGFQMARHDVQE